MSLCHGAVFNYSPYADSQYGTKAGGCSVNSFTPDFAKDSKAPRFLLRQPRNPPPTALRQARDRETVTTMQANHESGFKQYSQKHRLAWHMPVAPAAAQAPGNTTNPRQEGMDTPAVTARTHRHGSARLPTCYVATETEINSQTLLLALIYLLYVPV